MKEEIFQDCLEHKQNSNGKPFWSDLAEKYGYKSGEILRCAFKNECKKKGISSEEKEESSYEQGDDFINIVCSSKRMLTKDDVIKQFKIDLDEWEIDRFKVKTSEGYRKDRSVKWEVEDGVVINGSVHDTGKMLVVPLYHIEVHLVKKISQIQVRNLFEEMKADALAYAPKYPKIAYNAYKDGLMYEIGIPDLHFGRLSWGEESGEDYDIKLAQKAVDSVLSQLLNSVKSFHIEKILFPIGNDFFNSDNPINTTAHGTIMQEDVRWQKTFRKGREMAVRMIDQCSQIAPVEVLVLPGNHDTQRSFFLGEALSCWYNNNPNVKVDNSAMSRKYYAFGTNLIGFAHGQTEKLTNLPLLMAVEVPELWANSTYREWHTGHTHNKKDYIFSANEGNGIVVRVLRSLAVADAWTFNSGFVKPLRAGEGFLWHPTLGLTAQFTAVPILE